MGWLLVVPFVGVLVNEIRLLGLVAFTDYNQNDMGSIELVIGAGFLVITGLIALGGWALIRRGRRRS